MILLVMADTHNNFAAIRTALKIGRQRGAAEVLHCGDVSTESALEEFAGWTLHLALGNMDREPAALRVRVARLGNRSECGREIRLEIDGVRIAALHGDQSTQLKTALHQGNLDFLFYGHSHKRQDETIERVRVINPGALGGVASEPHSFCMLDTVRRDVEFFQLDDMSYSPE